MIAMPVDRSLCTHHAQSVFLRAFLKRQEMPNRENQSFHPSSQTPIAPSVSIREKTCKAWLKSHFPILCQVIYRVDKCQRKTRIKPPISQTRTDVASQKSRNPVTPPPIFGRAERPNWQIRGEKSSLHATLPLKNALASHYRAAMQIAPCPVFR
ncbi:hypothetical protein VTL71DRAFT_12848 [Oculimacula yallundae]|uniref:Uncharacterized protein n=1 Tax=Oculimacula yallundae TaxID=86028 RepID=A0ABR4CNL6_9HELO